MVLTNVYWKLKQNGDLDQDEDLDRKLRQKIIEIGQFLAKPDNFEGDYNHGFNEAAALILISENFHEASGCNMDYTATALERLDALMEDAVDEDGVEVEQSPYYHIYVLVFAWQIYDWANRFDIPMSDYYMEKIDAMVRYTMLIATPDGEIPLIGASILSNIRTYKESVMDEASEDYPSTLQTVTHKA